MSDDRKDLPSPSASNWQQSMTEAMRTYMGRTGNLMDRGVTVRDLVDAGIVDAKRAGGRFAGLAVTPGLGGGTTIIGGGGSDGGDTYEPDLTPPPTPTGLKVTGMTTHLFIEHDAASYTQGHGHDRTILYGASYAAGDPLPTFAAAKMLAQFQGNVHALPVQIGTRYRIWIKWQTVDDVQSADPAGGTNGVLGQTGLVGGVDLSDNIITAQKLAAGAIDALEKFAPGLQPIGNVQSLPAVSGYAGPTLVYLVPEGKLYRLIGGAWTKEVDAADLKAGSIDATKFAAAIEPIGMPMSQTLPTVKTTSTIFWSGKLYRWNGSAYTAAVAVADLAGQLADAQIAAVAAGKITGTLTGDQLADSAISLTKFAAGLRPVEVLGALPTTGNTVGRMVLLTTDGKLYRYTGGAWTAAVAAGDLSGKIVSTQITDGAVTTPLLAAGAVTADILAANAVTAGKIVAGAIGTDQLAANAIVAAKIATGAIETAAIKAGAITAAKIAADTITANEIAANAITASELAADSVVAGKVAALAINTRELVVGAVTADILAANSVIAAKIAANAITADKIQAGAIVAGKLAASSIVAGDGVIQNAAITNALIANLAVDNAKIANLAVDKLLAGSLAVGQYIQSSNFASGSAGFRITAAGTLEANSAYMRGTVFATAGQIGGITIANNYIASTNFNEAARTGFYLGADGRLVLPGGSVTADMLNVGVSGNLISNSTWIQRQASNVPTDWIYFDDGDQSSPRTVLTGVQFDGNFPDGSLPNGTVLRSTNTAVGNSQFMCIYSAPIAIVGGQRCEFSVYSGAINSLTVTDIEFYDRYATLLGYGSNITALTNSGEGFSGKSLADFKRIGTIADSPANAAWARPRIIKRGRPTNTSDTTSYAMLVRPYFGVAGKSQTAFTPYAPSGLGTLITPQGIVTPSVAAISATLGDVKAGSVRNGGYDGYYWPAANRGGGFYLGPEGLLIGNPNVTGQGYGYLQLTAAGNLYAPGLMIEAGRLFINQVDAVNTVNIAGQAVTVSDFAMADNQMNLAPGGGNGFPPFTELTINGFNSGGASILVTIGANFTAQSPYYEGGD